MSTHPPFDPRPLTAELEATRRQFHALVAGLSPDELGRPSRNPAWSNKELLYHLAATYQAVMRQAGRIRRGTWRPEAAANSQGWLEGRRLRWAARLTTPAGLIWRYDAAHAAAQRLIGQLAPDDWRRSVDYPCLDPPLLCGEISLADLLRYPARHFQAHRADLAAGDRKPDDLPA